MATESHRRSRRLVVVIVIVLAASIWTWMSVAARQYLPRKPFTFYFVESSSSHTGTSASREMFRAERGDGAVSYGLSGEVSRRRLVVNRREMWRAEVSDTERLKTTYAAPPRTRQADAKMPAVPGDCGLVSTAEGGVLGVEAILGYDAYHYEKVTQERGVTKEDHTWFSPALGCFDVKRVVHRRDTASGEVLGTFERRPLRIIFGEPDDRLFVVPPDYREVAPSELEDAQLRSRVKAARGADAAEQVAPSPGFVRGLQEMDQKYWRLKK